MLSMTTNAYDYLYWFEKVGFESETNGFCSSLILNVKRLNVVHFNKSLWSSVLIWTNLLRIWNQRILQQQCSCGETSQCCPWRPKPMIIGTKKKFSSNLKTTVSAATVILWRTVSKFVHDSQNQGSSVLIWRSLLRIGNQRFPQQPFRVCGTSQCCSWKPNLWWSVLIWRSLLRSWS